MSTQVTIVKKPSGHDLLVIVQNPGAGAPTTLTLSDNQAVEVMIYGGSPEQGGGTLTIHEINKSKETS